ncbi:hypothetical protein SAMN05421636_105233 [Pricia antarctica]|uniref:Uncharacterized protein n=1 Tax=Pricia antarctica TaxID=641691 RepID=A0A1G7D9S7_9FLAO|nr:hypothetical protein SAMN05421636_105233 [Pricia antarctica]
MVAYLFHFGAEKNPLKKVQVLGDHRDHIDIPTFGKGLHGGLQFCTGQGMETMFHIDQLIVEKIFVLYLFVAEFFSLF